jgi:hypothetical protein
MQAPLATPNPFEVLHGIGHVNFIAGNPRVLERPVEHAAGGPDKWLAFLIFDVAGLLANQHHTRSAGPRAKNGLGSIKVEITSFAGFCRLPERFKRTGPGQEIASRTVLSYFGHHGKSLAVAWYDSR